MVKECDVDVILARAQIVFAGMMLVGIFALLFVLIFFHGAMTDTAVTIVTSVTTALVTVFTLQMNFFYARQRPHALPDANTTSITTTPDGGSTVVTPSSTSVKVTPPNPLVSPQPGVKS